jgi:hypothetical protein
MEMLFGRRLANKTWRVTVAPGTEDPSAVWPVPSRIGRLLGLLSGDLPSGPGPDSRIRLPSRVRVLNRSAESWSLSPLFGAPDLSEWILSGAGCFAF